MSKNVKLKTNEILVVEQEYADVLKNKLRAGLKLDLLEDFEQIAPILKNVKEIQNELIKKYGEVEGEKIFVKQFEDDTNTKVSEKYIEFVKEFNEVLNKEYDLTFNSYSEEAIEKVMDIDTEINYVILKKIFKA